MFNSNYFRKRKYLAWRAPIICSAIKRVFRPTSVIDFGCSIGDIVRGLNELAVPAIGIDLCEELFAHSHPETPIIVWDVTQPLPTLCRFDLALCIEVLRFIPDEKLDHLLHNFMRHSKRVLIGYGGDRRDFVISKMKSVGYTKRDFRIEVLRANLEPWKHKPAVKALYHGGMYFTHD